MPRNVEEIQRLYGSDNALPAVGLADNALKLGGYEANLYVLKKELTGEVNIVLGNIDAVIKDLETHMGDDTRHLTEKQITIINSAIDAIKALEIANSAIANAKPSIISEAVQSATRQANDYTIQEVAALKVELEKQIGNLKLPETTDPETGETIDQSLSDALETNPQNLISAEHFYRFKNMIDNSSFEVFDGNTLIPIGWDNGKVSSEASMFGTYSLMLETGQTAKQTNRHQTNVKWMENAYDTDDCILCFYHKLDPVIVKIYDVVNETYLDLTALSSTLEELGTSKTVEFPKAENWNQYRCMVKFTPSSTTEKIRIEFSCASGSYGECYIDAPSLEPYVTGQFPSIYKDGRYSVSAHQIINPPPADVDRFTPLEHFTVANCVADENGNLTHQELLREDGTLAIKREASNPDEKGNYQTIVETFYKADGVTVNYVDTYAYTYTSTGAILTQSKNTTEVI